MKVMALISIYRMMQNRIVQLKALVAHEPVRLSHMEALVMDMRYAHQVVEANLPQLPFPRTLCIAAFQRLERKWEAVHGIPLYIPGEPILAPNLATEARTPMATNIIMEKVTFYPFGYDRDIVPYNSKQSEKGGAS